MKNKIKFLCVIIFILSIFTENARAVEKIFLPVSFDLREYGRLTDPKFQNFPGPCWAFAAIGACESNYLTQNLKNKNLIDLSEMHLAYFAYKNPDNKKNFTPFKSGGGILGSEGNIFISTAVLSRLGAVKERDMPYSMQSLKNAKLKFTPYLRITDVFYMSLSPEPLAPDIKKYLIKNHGAIVTSLYSDWNKYREINGFYTYYNNSHGFKTTHDVILTGWDDNFSRENFRPRPLKNGAWIARNSWGSGWGNNGGYFYISYEQYLRGGAAFVVTPYDKNLRYYGHDELGWCRNLNKKYKFAANIFKVRERREILSEVALYTTENNANYNIYIYDLGEKMPDSPVKNGKLLFETEGNFEFSGYHTVKLKDFNNDLNKNLNLILRQNQYFSVIIKLSCPIACESKISGYSDNFEIKKGESYFSVNGKAWNDGINLNAPGSANACIKAFTRVIF